VPKGNYVLNIKDMASDFKSLGNELQDLLNSASPNKYTYTITTTNNKLNFVVSDSNNSAIQQPIFNLEQTSYPEKFGFKNSTYSFATNKLESQFSIEDYTLVKGDCPEEKMCGNICCENTCVENNGIKTCCPKENVCGEGYNKTCCPPNADGTTNCCDGKCCNSANGEKCVKDETTGVSKCLKKCPKPGPTGEDVYCDTNTPGTFCEEATNPNNNSKVSYCKHKDCVFGTENYNPENINDIPVCIAQDNKLYSKYINGLNLTRELRSRYTVDTSKCTPDDCVSKLIELGASDMTSEPESGKCTTTFNCELLLNNNPDQCPFTEDKQNQCCMIGGKFTGQVCQKNYTAEPDPQNANECICVKGWICSDDQKAPAGKDGNIVNTGKVCKLVLKDSDIKGRTLYNTREDCEKAGCKCATGWRWNKVGEETCNDFVCKDINGKNRPDIYRYYPEINTCMNMIIFDGQSAIDNSGQRYISYAVGPSCNLNCDNVYKDFPPGVGMCGWNNIFSCQGTPVDITGATNQGVPRFDKVTQKNVIYMSNSPISKTEIGYGCDYNCLDNPDTSNNIPSS
jgi:hypothetical protein